MICETCGEEIDNIVCPFCETVNSSIKKSKKQKKIAKINIKDDMPIVEVALERMAEIIKNKDQFKVVKIVHGYGSSGRGGNIKEAVRKMLAREVVRGTIKGFIAGEEFSGAYDNTLKMLKLYPFIESDEDHKKSNPGITLIVF